MKKQEFEKNEARLRNLWDNFKGPTSELYECQKEKRKNKN